MLGARSVTHAKTCFNLGWEAMILLLTGAKARLLIIQTADYFRSRNSQTENNSPTKTNGAAASQYSKH